ncbi:DUF4244 domain-containing protein [Gordonia phosphorivorans]|uniref:DUF4244 domain-containing protein n=1 Tax=Gordonia phosphorivorans TaxID=1056982 RepID=A0ABV6H3B2_9ACTN
MSNHPFGSVTERIGAEVGRLISDDSAMSTAEYAIGTVAAAAFGAILYTVISGDNVVSALTGIISRALSTSIG